MRGAHVAKKKQEEGPRPANPEDLAIGVLVGQLAADIRVRNELERSNQEMRRERDRQEHERLLAEGLRLDGFMRASAKQNLVLVLLLAVFVLSLLQLLGVDLASIAETASSVFGSGGRDS